MRDKQEVEVVDFLLQVKDCVVSATLAAVHGTLWNANTLKLNEFPSPPSPASPHSPPPPLLLSLSSFSFIPSPAHSHPPSPFMPSFLPFPSPSPLISLQSRATKQYPSVPPQTIHVLQSQIRTIISRLPEDLQSCLKSTFTAPS